MTTLNLTQITNGRILTPQGWLKGGSIIVDGAGHIAEISDTEATPDGCTTFVDARGMYIVPGAIEMHVHGGGGRDFMEGTEDAFRTAIEAHMQHGTTAIYPTLSSSSVPMIMAAAETTERMMREKSTPILGLHLEGPYFNKEQAGGQMMEYITAPRPEDYRMIMSSTHCIKRWDEAPELIGTEDFGRAPFFLIVDGDTLDYQVIENEFANGDGPGYKVAKAIADLKPDHVICGGIGCLLPRRQVQERLQRHCQTPVHLRRGWRQAE